MSKLLDDKLRAIINKKETYKVIATIGMDEEVHAVFKENIYANSNDEIILCEIIESSVTNKNLVNSIWFNKIVCFNFLTPDHESYLIRCRPTRVIVSGKEFQYYYNMIEEKYGSIDLSAIWFFQVVEVKNVSLKKRWIEEQRSHPIIKHLDRILSE